MQSPFAFTPTPNCGSDGESARSARLEPTTWPILHTPCSEPEVTHLLRHTQPKFRTAPTSQSSTCRSQWTCCWPRPRSATAPLSHWLQLKLTLRSAQTCSSAWDQFQTWPHGLATESRESSSSTCHGLSLPDTTWTYCHTNASTSGSLCLL